MEGSRVCLAGRTREHVHNLRQDGQRCTRWATLHVLLRGLEPYSVPSGGKGGSGGGGGVGGGERSCPTAGSMATPNKLSGTSFEDAHQHTS